MGIIGLDIGGTKILGALLNRKGKILETVKVATKGDEGFYVIIEQIHYVIDELTRLSEKDIKGIGVGVPGTVSKKGVVEFCANLPLIDFDLRNHLKKRYGIPVKVGNDVNLGTFGECKELDIDYDNVIGLFPGTGLGGGIIINGELYIGQGSAGELGHIAVTKGGYKCGCGNNGCLETHASKKGLLHYMKEKLKEGQTSILVKDISQGILKSSKLKKAYDNKDQLTIDAMNQFIDYFAIGIGNTINIFNPELIIIGGGIIEAFGDDLLNKCITKAKEHTMPNLLEMTTIETSKLGDYAVIYGGYHLIKEKLIKSK